jgi:hypothetical protein
MKNWMGEGEGVSYNIHGWTESELLLLKPKTLRLKRRKKRAREWLAVWQ